MMASCVLGAILVGVWLLVLWMWLDERNGYIDTYTPPTNEETARMNYDTIALTRLADDDHV